MSARIRTIAATAVLVAGCTAPAPTGSPAAASTMPIATSGPATSSVQSPAPTQDARPSADLPAAPGHSLEALSYSWYLDRPGVEFPILTFTIPFDPTSKMNRGWGNDGRFTYWGRPGSGEVQIAMQFWDVGEVYGHPCKWQGTLFDPGPTVDDLANALVDIPMRHASEPVDVSIDGYLGKYLEWSVPADIGSGTTEQEVFKDCDTDAGEHYFESWIGDPAGWGGDRYHQAAGQIDRLWILDVDGVRFVIDAFSMPGSTKNEIATLVDVVESITFER